MPAKLAPRPAPVPAAVLDLVDRPLPGERDLYSEPGARHADVSLDAIEGMDPEKALMFLELQEKLEARKLKQADKAAAAQFSINTLKAEEEKARAELAERQACGARGHVNESGHPAISGQECGDHSLILVCMRCQQNFTGVGSGPEQLPTYIYNRLNHQTIGKLA